MDTQYRAELDFDTILSNGGALHGQEFRIDIAGPDLSDAELGAALVRDLGLLMVGEVRITRREILADRHKRPPGMPTSAT
jgi:arylformamidase